MPCGDTPGGRSHARQAEGCEFVWLLSHCFRRCLATFSGVLGVGGQSLTHRAVGAASGRFTVVKAFFPGRAALQGASSNSPLPRNAASDPVVVDGAAQTVRAASEIRDRRMESKFRQMFWSPRSGLYRACRRFSSLIRVFCSLSTFRQRKTRLFSFDPAKSLQLPVVKVTDISNSEIES